MFCQNCGNQFENPNAKFCSKCGAPAPSSESTQKMETGDHSPQEDYQSIVSKFKPGGVLSGQVFTIKDGMLHYRDAYGKNALVPISSIQAVTIDALKRGNSMLKIIGHGTELANIKLPHPWAQKTLLWLNKTLKL